MSRHPLNRHNRKRSLFGRLSLVGLLSLVILGGLGCSSEPRDTSGTCGGNYTHSSRSIHGGTVVEWPHGFYVSTDPNATGESRFTSMAGQPDYVPICQRECDRSQAIINERTNALGRCLGLLGDTSSERALAIRTQMEQLTQIVPNLRRECDQKPVPGLKVPEGDSAQQMRTTNAEQAERTCKCALPDADFAALARDPCGGTMNPFNQLITAQNLSSNNRGAGGSIINTPENNAAAARNTQAGSGSGVGNAGLLSGNVNAATAGGRPTSSLNFNQPSPLSSNSPSGGDPNKVPARTFSTGGSSPTGGAGSSTSSAGGPSRPSTPGNNPKSTDTPSLGGPVLAQDPYGGATQSAATGGGYTNGGITRSATGGGLKEEAGFTFGSSGGSGPGGAGGTPGSQSFNGAGGAGGSSNFAQGVQDAEDYFTRVPLEASVFEIVEKRYRKFDSLWSAEDIKTSTTPAQP